MTTAVLEPDTTSVTRGSRLRDVNPILIGRRPGPCYAIDWMSFGLMAVLVALVVGPAPVSDVDADGLPDYIEDRDRDGRISAEETDPRRPDSDRDGVPDGVEDRDRDGRVDRGESDPRVPGLFPGSSPHIPEPLAFDMVRGLGARAGEVEMNTLLLPRWSRGGLELEWAPEIEWAPRDNLALEIELPMRDGHLHALKAAVQGTLPRRRQRAIAGWQVIGELLPGDSTLATTALYLVGLRLNRRWSVLAIGGLRMNWTRRPLAAHTSLLLNPSVFVDVRERVTLGVEHNLSVDMRGEVSAVALPQFHIQMGRQWRVQCGLGVGAHGRSAAALGGLRLVFEL